MLSTVIMNGYTFVYVVADYKERGSFFCSLIASISPGVNDGSTIIRILAINTSTINRFFFYFLASYL